MRFVFCAVRFIDFRYCRFERNLEIGARHSHSFCGGKCTLCNTYIDNDNTQHIDNGNNVCTVCLKYIGTKDLSVGSNSIDANDVSYYNSKLKVIRFVAAISGTYTIGSDMVYENYEYWYIFDDLANFSAVAVNTSDDEDVSVAFTAGEAYYFVFQSGSSKTDFTLTITAPAHTHVFTEVAYKAASCTQAGNEVYKYCTVCKKYFAATADTNEAFKITKLEHSYTGALKSNGDTKDGTHSSKCIKGCNGYSNETPHVWDNGKVTTPATHLKEGVKTFTCVCGATYTEPVAKTAEHSYVDNVVAPSCTEKGYTEHACACGDKFVDSYVDANGHNYENGTCTECGDVDPDYNNGDDNDNSDCDCICHNSNKFVQFIYKIVRWFRKLFNIRKTCDCGVVHY